MAFGAGAISTRLLLDFSNFAGGFAQVKGIMGGFPAAVTSLLSNPLEGFAQVAGAAMEAVKEAVGGVVESVHQVSVEASKAGVSTGFLKQLGAAGKTVDTNIQEVAHSLAFLGRNAADAAEGQQTAVAAFGQLGISATDAAGKIKPTEQLFFEVADAIKALPTPAQQTKAAMDLLSRGGIEMVPILKKGSEGIREIAAEMKRLSGGSPEGLEENSEKFHEAETRISAALAGIKRAIAAPIIEVFAKNADGIVEAVAKIAKVIREGFGGAVSAMAPLLGGFFKALSGVAELVSGVVIPVFKALQPLLELIGNTLGKVFELIGKVLGGIGSAVRGVTDFLGLTSPNAGAGAGGAAGGAGAGGGGTTVNIDKIEVAAPDVNEATTQIAQKLQRPMQEGIKKHKQSLDGAAAAAFTVRSL